MTSREFATDESTQAPTPDPLYQFDQETFGPRGGYERKVVLTSDSTDPLSDKRIVADPDDVVDLERWR